MLTVIIRGKIYHVFIKMTTNNREVQYERPFVYGALMAKAAKMDHGATVKVHCARRDMLRHWVAFLRLEPYSV